MRESESERARARERESERARERESERAREREREYQIVDYMPEAVISRPRLLSMYVHLTWYNRFQSL